MEIEERMAQDLLKYVIGREYQELRDGPGQRIAMDTSKAKLYLWYGRGRGHFSHGCPFPSSK